MKDKKRTPLSRLKLIRLFITAKAQQKGRVRITTNSPLPSTPQTSLYLLDLKVCTALLTKRVMHRTKRINIKSFVRISEIQVTRVGQHVTMLTGDCCAEKSISAER